MYRKVCCEWTLVNKLNRLERIVVRANDAGAGKGMWVPGWRTRGQCSSESVVEKKARVPLLCRGMVVA